MVAREFLWPERSPSTLGKDALRPRGCGGGRLSLSDHPQYRRTEIKKNMMAMNATTPRNDRHPTRIHFAVE
jgi:hypothetical protein